jgi:hypothetical protein
MSTTPEGFGIVTGRSRERAKQLLDTATELGIDQTLIEVRPMNGGYLVPNAIIEHLTAQEQLAADANTQRKQAEEDRRREIADQKAGTSAQVEPAEGETTEDGVVLARTTNAPEDVPAADEAQEGGGPAEGKPLEDAATPADVEKTDEAEKPAPKSRTRKGSSDTPAE